jgi:homoprotocatechuate degradation regulator HpaR
VIEANTARAPARDLSEAASAPAADCSGMTKSLLHAREAVMRQLRPSLRMHGLTEQQWRVLCDLTTVTEIAASELAAATCLRASSLSRIIKDLENRGLLSRRSQLEDLRRTLVSITPRGRGLLQQLAPTSAGIYADIAARFGAEKLSQLTGLADELVAAFGGPAAASDDDGE